MFEPRRFSYCNCGFFSICLLPSCNIVRSISSHKQTVIHHWSLTPCLPIPQPMAWNHLSRSISKATSPNTSNSTFCQLTNVFPGPWHPIQTMGFINWWKIISGQSGSWHPLRFLLPFCYFCTVKCSIPQYLILPEDTQAYPLLAPRCNIHPYGWLPMHYVYFVPY